MTRSVTTRRVGGILTLFGLGYVRYSASIASAIAAASYVVLHRAFGSDVAGLVLLIAVAAWTAVAAIKNAAFVETDPKEAVIDEFLGMLVCLLVARDSSFVAISAMFVAFRVLDILKPPPFGWLDRNVHGTFGFVLDDALIGATVGAGALLVVWLVQYFAR